MFWYCLLGLEFNMRGLICKWCAFNLCVLIVGVSFYVLDRLKFLGKLRFSWKTLLKILVQVLIFFFADFFWAECLNCYWVLHMWVFRRAARFSMIVKGEFRLGYVNLVLEHWVQFLRFSLSLCTLIINDFACFLLYKDYAPRRGRPRIYFPKVGEPTLSLSSPPPLSPPPSPHIVEQANGNKLDIPQLLEKFTRIMSTALQGRSNTKVFDIKIVKELKAHDYFGSIDLAEVECWLTEL